MHTTKSGGTNTIKQRPRCSLICNQKDGPCPINEHVEEVFVSYLTAIGFRSLQRMRKESPPV